MQRGYALIQVAVALTILAIVVGIATPRAVHWRDRLAVRRATRQAATFYATARLAAVFRAARVRVTFSADSLTAVAEGASDSLLFRRPGPVALGVSLRVSRSVIRLHPGGLGLGSANTKLVFTRGTARDSLTVSRLGRLRMGA